MLTACLRCDLPWHDADLPGAQEPLAFELLHVSAGLPPWLVHSPTDQSEH